MLGHARSIGPLNHQTLSQAQLREALCLSMTNKFSVPLRMWIQGLLLQILTGSGLHACSSDARLDSYSCNVLLPISVCLKQKNPLQCRGITSEANHSRHSTDTASTHMPCIIFSLLGRHRVNSVWQFLDSSCYMLRNESTATSHRAYLTCAAARQWTRSSSLSRAKPRKRHCVRSGDMASTQKSGIQAACLEPLS